MKMGAIIVKFKDKTVIVTGGSRGIGKSIVEKIWAEGGNVMIADLTSPESNQMKKYGPRVQFISTNVSSSEDVNQMILQTVHRFGKIHGLVNNAMITRAEHFLEISESSWNEFLSVGLTGAFLCGQQIAKHFADHSIKGNIVNIASINSFAAEKCAAHYVTVKGGLSMLTKGMAVDLAPYGIRVNAVAPGLIETEKTTSIFKQKEYQEQIHRIPLRRTGTGEEVANLVSFLLSEESSYITGEIYKMDGGLLSVIS